MTEKQRDIKRKLAVLEYANRSGDVARICRRFGISRQCYCNFAARVREARRSRPREPRPVPREPRAEGRRSRPQEKIARLRLTYHFGPARIAWYLGRYHGFSISTHGVYNVLVRNGINRLPTSCHERSMPSVRYQKQVLRPPRSSRRQVPVLRGF